VTEVRKSALVPFSAENMFDLIEAAEDYPAFLPWCAGATVLARDESVVAARLAVDFHGVRFQFSTRNPKRRPEFMAIRIEQGPFRNFDGEWHLTPLAPECVQDRFPTAVRIRQHDHDQAGRTGFPPHREYPRERVCHPGRRGARRRCVRGNLERDLTEAGAQE